MATEPLKRRHFLRSTGVAVGLPALASMQSSRTDAAASPNEEARRMLAICAPLGIHTPYLFPKTSGKDYDVTPYLEPLQKMRAKFSVISGLSHPMVDGGHAAESSFLTGAAHPGQPSFRNSISVDQHAADRLGHLTRFPSLTLSADSRSISYTASGVMIPAESRPSRVFERFFLEGSEKEKAAQLKRIQDGKSILDLVAGQAKSMGNLLAGEDHHTLDQYFSSVRETERRLTLAEEWADRPKPKVEGEPLSDVEDRTAFTERMQVLFDLIFLALQTDSTRLITLKGPGGAEVVQLDGVDDGWHNLSHHGRDEEKIRQLAIIEKEEMRLFAEFLAKLDSVQEGDHTLLDQTAILMGSNLGNASSHDNRNLPLLAAGGHFRHGSHLAFDPERSPPMANLLVSFLQHLQLNFDQFSSGTGTLDGLEPLS